MLKSKDKCLKVVRECIAAGTSAVVGGLSRDHMVIDPDELTTRPQTIRTEINK